MLASLFEPREPIPDNELIRLRKCIDYDCNRGGFSIDTRWLPTLEGYAPKTQISMAREDYDSLDRIEDALRLPVVVGKVIRPSVIVAEMKSLTTAHWDYLIAAQNAWCRVQAVFDALHAVEVHNSMVRSLLYALNTNPQIFSDFSCLRVSEPPADTAVLRYVLSTATSSMIAQAYWMSYSERASQVLHTHAALFALPAREDWASCNFTELAMDFFHAVETLNRILGEVRWSTCTEPPRIFRHCVATSHIRIESPFSYLLRNLRFLRDSLKPKPVVVSEENKHGLRDAEYRPDCEIFKAIKDVSPLPQSISGIELSHVSGAYLPAFYGKDQWGVTFCLVPESPKVCDQLRKLYGLPKHDALYPESRETQALLYPNSAGFGLVLAHRLNLVYAGMESLGEWVELPGADTPEYKCHKFFFKN